MTEERLVLAELLEKAGDGDFLRAVAEAVLQLLMESDVEGMIGAGRYERSGERTTWRNGYRERTLPLDAEHVFGVLSMIFWALIIVVAVKYVLLIMRADNQREGGILAFRLHAGNRRTASTFGQRDCL